MVIRVAINGYGRIGRNIVRALYESKYRNIIKIVAINDLADVKTNVHLTQHDSIRGKFNGNISYNNSNIIINDDVIPMFSESDPSKLPWRSVRADIVHECTGRFTERNKASLHLHAGAKKVLISAPGQGVDATIVYGVNHNVLKGNDIIISNASCTTNCLATLIKPLMRRIGVVRGFMVTIHASTNDQVLQDSNHHDLRRARSVMPSMIPTKSGATSVIESVLPKIAGRLDGYAVRVPVQNVSLVDLTFISAKPTTPEFVNRILEKASKKSLKKTLVYSELPLVSSDFSDNPASAIVDASETRVIGNLVKVIAWYDNEWGFANRMLDTTLSIAHVFKVPEFSLL